jgi:lantibiotic modifying enzyme
MEELSTQTEGGIAWFTPPQMVRPKARLSFPDGYYDLGVAHGAAGIISFLSRVYALGISKELTGKLLYGAVSWMFSQQLKKESKPGPLFPEYVLPSDVIRSLTGGWCHGDIGMAAALLSAARSTGETSWETKALETAHASIDGFNPNWRPGTTLCHGTAGMGHLFNRLYQATGETRFKQEARKWFERTIEQREPGKGIAGFYRHSPNEEGEISEQYDPGFIQGAAGIGLALLASAVDLEPQWDRVLLLT